MMRPIGLPTLCLLGSITPVLTAGIQPAYTQTIQVITGLEIRSNSETIQLQLETASGVPPRFLPPSPNYDRVLVIDLLDARLKAGPLSQSDPTHGIELVRVDQRTENSVRVTIIGGESLPPVSLEATDPGLVISFRNPSPEPVVSQPSSTPTPPPPDPVSNSETPDVELEEITVTADRPEIYNPSRSTTATRIDAPLRDIPRSIQVIPQQVIEDQKAIRIDDVLQNVSGVARDNSFGGTADGFLIRGFAADIFRNGLPDVPGTSAFSSARETANLDQVEVLKGPASILFGSLSPGGVINLVTKEPLDEPFSNVEFTGGSFSLYRPSLDLSGPLTPDGSGLYRLNAVYENASSFRDFTEIERIFVAPVISWKGDRTQFKLELEYLNDERPFDRGLVAIGDQVADIPIERRLGEPGDVRRVEDLSLGYELDYTLSENWTLKNTFRALLSDNFTRRFEPRSLDEETGILEREFRITEGTRQSYGIRTETLGNWITGPIQHQLLFGLDASRIIFDETGFRERPTTPINIFAPEYGAPIPDAPLSFDTNIRSHALGVYFQDLASLGDQVKLLVGGRLDSVSQDNNDTVAETDSDQNDTAFSPSVGLVYQPDETLSVYGSFSRSFQPNFLTSADGSFLEPERGTQYELGVKADFLDGRLTSTLALYYLVKSNVGITDPNDPDFSIPVGEQRSQGIEWDLAGEISPGWKILANYTYTDAIISQGDEFTPTGNLFPNVPRNSASLWTTYERVIAEQQRLGLGLGGFFVDDRAGDTENTFTLPSYLRTDAALYYQAPAFRASLNFQNLFDIRYFESSGFGRERITPGAPFTVLGSVDYEF